MGPQLVLTSSHAHFQLIMPVSVNSIFKQFEQKSVQTPYAHVDMWTMLTENTMCHENITAEMKWSLLNDIDSTTFDQVRRILNNCLGVLWLGCGGLIAGSNPYCALTLNKTDRRFVHLDFESCVDHWTLNNSAHIMTFLHSYSFDYSCDRADIEGGVCCREGYTACVKILS